MGKQENRSGSDEHSLLGSVGEGLKGRLKQARGGRRSGPAGANPFDTFTIRARQVLALAQEEARHFNHDYIGTEHLLLGLLLEGDGVAAKALTNLGVDLDRVRGAVERIIGRGEHIVSGEVGLTPRTKKVLELALEEARQLKHRFIGTEHVLLGLAREGEGIAADVLTGLGVTLEQVRAEVLDVLGGITSAPKGHVVMCRLDDRAVDALDTLIEAGIRSTRSEAAAWLIQEGITAKVALFQTVSANVAQIRRLRDETQRLAQQVTGESIRPGADSAHDEQADPDRGPPQQPTE